MTMDIEREGTCGVCGSEIVVADGRVVRVGKLLDPRIERVVEAAKAVEKAWSEDRPLPFYPLREALWKNRT